jgi:hypothetical protein
MMQRIFIGLDDTDAPGGPGTGRVARGMAQHLESLGMGVFQAVVRHQLLVDPRIPYTSHNSAKCIEFEAAKPLVELRDGCAGYIAANFQAGSDPGLCLCPREGISPEIIEFGQRAIKNYIAKQEALLLGKKLGMILVELGGTGDGVIGALAAVGLSAGGNDGRYVQLRGIKEIQGLVTVGDLRTKTGIVRIVDEGWQPLGDGETIDSMGWVRPSLFGGEPVLRVRRELGSAVWLPVERRHKTEKEAKETRP